MKKAIFEKHELIYCSDCGEPLLIEKDKLELNVFGGVDITVRCFNCQIHRETGTDFTKGFKAISYIPSSENLIRKHLEEKLSPVFESEQIPEGNANDVRDSLGASEEDGLESNSFGLNGKQDPMDDLRINFQELGIARRLLLGKRGPSNAHYLDYPISLIEKEMIDISLKLLGEVE